MEFPRSALILQRLLAALLLGAVLSVALVERSSPFAARRREGKPWPFWLAVRTPGRAAAPALHLGVYHPLRRVLVLIFVPETTKIQGKLTAARVWSDALKASGDEAAAERAVVDLAQLKISSLSLEPVAWEGAGRLGLEAEPGEEDEPAAAAARALKARGRSPRALLALARKAAAGLRRGERSAADELLLTLELRAAPLESLQPALLPEDAAAPAFLGRSFAPAPEGDDGKPVVVEVLNGTGAPGLAAQAAKVLRSKGVDVMSLGAAEHPRSRTIVYDRTGDFNRAARVRAALGCATAIAATRIDALRGVDASVELGNDCRF